ncbi:MAG: hypothetical protein HXX16_12350 [Bacteroidales bacterium]|nr:hypothetical protein [Bacteroidales bacterium]
MFNSESERDRFFTYMDRYDYKLVYSGRPEKSAGWMGDHRGNRRLYLDRRCVLNFTKLSQDIQMFGGRIEI